MKSEFGRSQAPSMVLTQVNSSSTDNTDLKKQMTKLGSDLKHTNASIAVLSK